MSCCVSGLASIPYDENLASSRFVLVVGPRSSDLEKSCGEMMIEGGLSWSSRNLCARRRPARAVAMMMLVELASAIANGIGANPLVMLSVWRSSKKLGAVDHQPAYYMFVVAFVTSYVPRKAMRSKQPTWRSSKEFASFEQMTQILMHVRLHQPFQDRI